MLTVKDKLGAFYLKLNQWSKKIEERVLEMFPLTEAVVAETDELCFMKECICNHILQPRLFVTFLISAFLAMLE